MKFWEYLERAMNAVGPRAIIAREGRETPEYWLLVDYELERLKVLDSTQPAR